MSEYDLNDKDLNETEPKEPESAEPEAQPAEPAAEASEPVAEAAEPAAEPPVEAAEPAEPIAEAPSESAGEVIYEGDGSRKQPEPPANPQPRQTYPQYQSYVQNPYQQQNQQQQYRAQQPSMGYYQPHTNEYIYSPAPASKKSKAGRIALICIAAVLTVFVFSVGLYSVLTAGRNFNIDDFSDNLFADRDGSPVGEDDDHIDDHRNDTEIEGGDEDDEPAESDAPAQNTAVTHTPIRDYPSLEQLAAPEDAMSLPDIYDKVIESVVGVSCSVEGGTQTGTGFIIDGEEGYIVTNAHVIDGYISVMIVDHDLNEYEAEVIGYDTMSDIAVLRIDPSDKELIAVDLGTSADLRIGELAIAIGNPLGFDLYGTMTTGIISGLDRSVTISDITMNLLQTSASINHGNSGGPLIDAYGRVIGITSAKVDSTYGESLGFAIPIDEAIPIIENLIQYGYVIGRPSIGISGQDIGELLSLYLRLPQGVLVHSVTPGSGAEAAGILPEDVIIGIQGETITNMNELNNIKNQYSVGDTVTLTIYRIAPRSDSGGRSKGESFDVDVVLGESTPE